MQQNDAAIKALCASANLVCKTIEWLPQSGGDRLYARVQTDRDAFIATLSDNISENNTFLQWAQTLSSLHISVPNIIAVNEHKTAYLQQDLGTICLLDFVLKGGFTEQAFAYYKKVLAQLVQIQILGHQKIDYSLCLAAKRFDYKAALFDLNYFLQYYVSTTSIVYNEKLLQAEFEQLAKNIDNISPQGFMYRDLQGRNIMVQDADVFFIDFQGGMQGPPQYDVASLLYQAKANLPNQWREDLLRYYINEYCKLSTIDTAKFEKDYYNIVLMRLLQVLGAYGRRGIIEGKQHFLASIPFGIANVKEYASQQQLQNRMPLLAEIIAQL
ncbi:MAG: hypothetical protein RL660_2007 [Bacteroidota bacterium]|jgi:aminoglycoside/choline kinase family phosphotransferase